MTKFEGIVNGVTYTNVNDYNEALTKAIESGESVNATSHTTVENDPEPVAEPVAEPVNRVCYNEYVKSTGMLPEFDLDTLCGDPVDDTAKADYYCRKCLSKKALDNVLAKYNNFNDADKKQYRKDLKELIAKNKNSKEVTQKSIIVTEEKCRKIEDELDNANRENGICLTADEILLAEQNFYEELYKAVKSADANTGCVPTGGRDYSQHQPQDDIFDGFYKLLTEIFK